MTAGSKAPQASNPLFHYFFGPSREEGRHYKQRRCGLPKMHSACFSALDTGIGIIGMLWLESLTLLYSILFIPLQTHSSKLFLRQHKDVRKKAGHPSRLRQLSLCSNHRVTELAMHACKPEPIDLVSSFYD